MSPFLNVRLRIDRASWAISFAGRLRSVGTPRIRRMRSVSSSWRIGHSSRQLFVWRERGPYLAEQPLAQALRERVVLGPREALHHARVEAELERAVLRQDAHRTAALREDLEDRIFVRERRSGAFRA